jgi:hypothetical protein
MLLICVLLSSSECEEESFSRMGGSIDRAGPGDLGFGSGRT